MTTPPPEPSPTRPPPIGGKLDTGRLFNGITLHATVEPTPGADATTERVDPERYVLELKLKPRVPLPNRTIEELSKVNPKLPELLPALSTTLPAEAVSRLLEQLYPP